MELDLLLQVLFDFLARLPRWVVIDFVAAVNGAFNVVPWPFLLRNALSRRTSPATSTLPGP